MNEIKFKIAALRQEIEAGIKDLDRGRFQSYDHATLAQMADDVFRRGRIRLDALRLKITARLQTKKE